MAKNYSALNVHQTLITTLSVLPCLILMMTQGIQTPFFHVC